MTIDPARTEFILQNDPRLIAAIGVIVSHSARRAGLSNEVQEGLAEDAAWGCREMFLLAAGNGNPDSALKVVTADFPDRVEVMIEHSREAKATPGLDSFCGNASGKSEGDAAGSLENAHADHIQYEASGGCSRLTLIKYCHSRKPSSGL